MSSLRSLLLGFGLVVVGMPASAADRPNFLVILTDDHGIGDVSAYGASDVRTPHIDRLIADGARLDAMRSCATVCSPARAAILTGRNPDRVGVPGVIRTHPRDSWGYLAPSVSTLPDLLRREGYATAIVGKWHLGLESPNTPNERGFDHFHGFLGDMMDSYTTHRRHGINYMRKNTEVIDPPGHATDLFTDWSIAYLRERAALRAQPFFLYLAYNAPHFPIEPPADDLERVRKRLPGLDDLRMKNVAFVEHLDRAIGRVLAELDDLDLARDTIVIFTSDNGGSLPHGQSNAPFRDGKQSHFDGGLRVPFAIRWPGRTRPGSRIAAPAQTFDIFPTLIEAAGGEVPKDLDSESLLPLIDGRRVDHVRDFYFVRREGGPRYGGLSYEAIIRGDWKLMRNDPFTPYQLYHLASDPGEQEDRAALEPALVRTLSAALGERVRRGGATPWSRPTN
ncbi:MAG: sulfatase-like hydrolase/transferase [Isosphaeraceae bacterium]|nr:sulfatase-like hydrolase/transferase [Isosphaeraceae bacterium]